MQTRAPNYNSSDTCVTSQDEANTQHSKPKTKCCPYDDCNARFRQSGKLKRHIDSKHLDLRPFACSYPNCGKTYKRSDHLQRHLSTHTGDKKYACNVAGCKLAFYQKYHLRRHVSTVHAAPKYECNQCVPSIKFRKRSQLSKHESLFHNADNSYRCTFNGCARSFRSKLALSSHVQHAHTPRVCPHCKKTFKKKRLLKRHIRKGNCIEKNSGNNNNNNSDGNDDGNYSSTRVDSGSSGSSGSSGRSGSGEEQKYICCVGISCTSDGATMTEDSMEDSVSICSNDGGNNLNKTKSNVISPKFSFINSNLHSHALSMPNLRGARIQGQKQGQGRLSMQRSLSEIKQTSSSSSSSMRKKRKRMDISRNEMKTCNMVFYSKQEYLEHLKIDHSMLGKESRTPRKKKKMKMKTSKYQRKWLKQNETSIGGNIDTNSNSNSNGDVKSENDNANFGSCKDNDKSNGNTNTHNISPDSKRKSKNKREREMTADKNNDRNKNDNENNKGERKSREDSIEARKVITCLWDGCDRRFTRQSNMFEHYRTRHILSQVKDHYQYIQSSENDSTEHENENENDKEEDLLSMKKLLFDCLLCHRVFDSKYVRNKHHLRCNHSISMLDLKLNNLICDGIDENTFYIKILFNNERNNNININNNNSDSGFTIDEKIGPFLCGNEKQALECYKKRVYRIIYDTTMMNDRNKNKKDSFEKWIEKRENVWKSKFEAKSLLDELCGKVPRSEKRIRSIKNYTQ